MMDEAIKVRFDNTDKGIERIEESITSMGDKFDLSQKDQWKEITNNSKGISKLKGWVSGILGAGVISGILIGIVKLLGY